LSILIGAEDMSGVIGWAVLIGLLVAVIVANYKVMGGKNNRWNPRDEKSCTMSLKEIERADRKLARGKSLGVIEALRYNHSVSVDKRISFRIEY
jgi:hypothetical protein